MHCGGCQMTIHIPLPRIYVNEHRTRWLLTIFSYCSYLFLSCIAEESASWARHKTSACRHYILIALCIDDAILKIGVRFRSAFFIPLSFAKKKITDVTNEIKLKGIVVTMQNMPLFLLSFPYGFFRLFHFLCEMLYFRTHQLPIHTQPTMKSKSCNKI